ncbi:HAD-IIIC family phosphatase [Fulvivirga sediminis]|uniref:HAD-IIIC family phosphatase n=1 Tax=Fulvivirga sediminis TaxID=2803949 RepID=A0A937FBQ6_9BACT|nr:HAD-IIIC family phosphatase [Fulvivirga sediminis]MBL3658732.1 HAD-IIIC family phosphatase [Fulvivirga sediminis]
MKEVKCIVWDLDNTIWEGVLTEPGEVKLRSGMAEAIKELDRRGILHSIASKNNLDDAMAQLKAFGISEYFLFPEVHWDVKSGSVSRIKENLNIGMDTIVFVDDQAFERDEVSSVNAEVETFDALDFHALLDNPRLMPRFITEDSGRRRLMYQEEIVRKKEEEVYKGPQEGFLASLNMEFSISEAKEEDLQRAVELTERTNQLNATGRTYSYEELQSFMTSEDHRLYICELTDKYGSYGKIGLALIEIADSYWHLKMMLMSCRVLSRSVGTVLMTYIMNQAKADDKKLRADFKQTDRNKMMYVTYRFSNFSEYENDGQGNIVFENDLTQIQPFPHYIKVNLPEDVCAESSVAAE